MIDMRPIDNLQLIDKTRITRKYCKIATDLNVSPRSMVELLKNTNSFQCSYDSFGNHIAQTNLSNPWRFASKRLDESGLIFFGRRYFDSVSGRWVTPDPIGFKGGINLYAFVGNNPLSHLDLYGLSIYVDPPRVDPTPVKTLPVTTTFVSPTPVSTKQIAFGPISSSSASRSFGSKAKAATVGVANGAANFVVGSLHDMQTCAFLIGAGECEFLPYETSSMLHAIEETQVAQLNGINDWASSMFSIDPSDPIYQSFRSKTTMGLEIGSLVCRRIWNG